MEHLEKIKCKLVKCVYEELEHNWDNIDIEELGEVIDMIKDLEKSMYYESIVEAMKKDGSPEHIKWMKDEEELDHTTMHKKDHSE
jgi:hypothetical protein